MALRYFEDFEVGEASTFGRYEVTREEVIDFATKWDPQPFHIDDEAAARSVFGRISAASSHTYAICSRISHTRATRSAMVAALGVEGMEFPVPVHPGDTLSMSSECIHKRVSKTRPDRGIVKSRTRLLNQSGEVVFEMIAKFMVLRRPG